MTVAEWPARGTKPWDVPLRAYVDEADAAGAATSENVADALSEDGPARDLLDARYVVTEKQGLNLLDYVDSGTMEDQSAAVLQALADHPGAPFWLPAPGTVRCDQPLLVTTGNGLTVDGRIYAAAAMPTLLDWDNGAASAGAYAQDRFLVGKGVVDANLLADEAIAIGSVLRFTLGEGLTVKDPVRRGIHLRPAGAEVMGGGIRLHNTGTANVGDNIAIESEQGDVQLSDIVSRDFTVGLKDTGGGTWTDFHPWIGTSAQLAARYPTSCAFVLGKTSLLVNPYADTYRYGFRSAAPSGYAQSRVTNPKFYCNTTNLTNPLAAANPGAVYDLADGGLMDVGGVAFYSGHGTTPYALTQGSAARFSHTPDYVNGVPGGVTGLGHFRRGVRLGASSFNPTVFASVSGGLATASTLTGLMSVQDGLVTYVVRCVGVVASSGVSGNLRVGAIPIPAGASDVKIGAVSVTTSTGVDANGGNGGGVTVAPVTIRPTKSLAGVTTEVNLGSLMGASIEFTLTLTAEYTYPS